MSKQREIIISGVGGQGMILCGTMIAEAAAIHDHKRTTLSSEYGVETRGTFAKSDVIVSDEEIFFPDVTEPDLIICLAQVAYERYSGKTGDTLIVYNEAEVTPNPQQAAHEKGVNITQMAKELGHPAVVNIITMGIIVGLLDVVAVEGVEDALRRFFGKKGEKLVALNCKAFEVGYELGKSFR